MDTSMSVKAKDLVNGLREQELAMVFMKFGEEPFAKKIAHAIVEKRTQRPIERTAELAELIRRTVRGGKVHPATRVFQALRIAVNDELHVLEDGLQGGFSILNNDGRLVVISFHSLEDRIVKHYFESLQHEERGLILTKKPLQPTEDEVLKNNRSRSAKLRAVIKKI
jgi:16S rRNA (cytosine1402-N4)-methyltransferase